jgi:hypothetical protein
MREKPQPDPVPADDPPPHPAEPLQIDTPVIDTRVSNKGLKIMPKMDSTEVRDFAREDEDAMVALEKIEKSFRGQLTG